MIMHAESTYQESINCKFCTVNRLNLPFQQTALILIRFNPAPYRLYKFIISSLEDIQCNIKKSKSDQTFLLYFLELCAYPKCFQHSRYKCCHLVLETSFGVCTVVSDRVVD